MDLLSGKLYWPETLDAAHTYPMLEQDIDCDVLIIGAGSSGAQCAYYLSNYDLKVVVADKEKPGLAVLLLILHSFNMQATKHLLN